MEKNATTELTSTQGRWNLQQHCRHALCLSSFAELFANKVQWVLVECPWVSNPGALMLSPAVATPYCNATQQIPNSPPPVVFEHGRGAAMGSQTKADVLM